MKKFISQGKIIAQMSSHKKVLTNALSQFIGKTLAVVASLVIVKIVANMGTEFYGNYLTAYEFLAFFGIIADAGLFAIAVREMSKTRDEGHGTRDERDAFVLSNIFSMRLLLILGVTLLAGISAQFVPTYPPMVKIGIWITGISMALTIVAGTLSSVLQARMKIHSFSVSLVLGKIFLAAMIFWIARNAALFGENLFFTLLWAGVLSNIFFAGLVIFFAAREVPIRLGFDFSWWKKIFRISLPYGLALILQTLYLRINIIIISILLGASAVGIYGVGTRILESLLVLGVFFGQAALPRLSAEENHQEKGEQTLTWGMQILLLFSLPIIIGTFHFAPQIIELISSAEFLSHPGFFGSDKVLMWLVFTVFFAYFNQLFIFTLVAKNRQNYLLWVNSAVVILNTVLNVVFLPLFGIVAAAAATIFCEVVVFLLLLREIVAHYNVINFWNKNLLLILIANGILFAEIYLTPLRTNFWGAFIVGGVTYFGIMWYYRRRFLPISQSLGIDS